MQLRPRRVCRENHPQCRPTGRCALATACSKRGGLPAHCFQLCKGRASRNCTSTKCRLSRIDGIRESTSQTATSNEPMTYRIVMGAECWTTCQSGPAHRPRQRTPRLLGAQRLPRPREPYLPAARGPPHQQQTHCKQTHARPAHASLADPVLPQSGASCWRSTRPPPL